MTIFISIFGRYDLTLTIISFVFNLVYGYDLYNCIKHNLHDS